VQILAFLISWRLAGMSAASTSYYNASLFDDKAAVMTLVSHPW
jgi:hypothetical protein